MEISLAINSTRRTSTPITDTKRITSAPFLSYRLVPFASAIDVEISYIGSFATGFRRKVAFYNF
jgi:hypothetical protein